jgi:hypothetical protein
MKLKYLRITVFKFFLHPFSERLRKRPDAVFQYENGTERRNVGA